MTVEWRIPRESKELVGPIVASDRGVPVTDFQVAVVLRGSRPSEADWKAPDMVGDVAYVLIGPGTARPLPSAVYKLWVRWSTTAPEVPVEDDACTIYIT